MRTVMGTPLRTLQHLLRHPGKLPALPGLRASLLTTLICGLGTLLLQAAVHSQDTPTPIRFPRHPSLSPDGRLLAFSYQGDIWSVSSEGGRATRLTLHEAHDQLPSYSPDGRSIAFSSNREGSYDVWIMPADGGRPRRLTSHGADDLVSGWTPDGKQVLFHSLRETTRTAAVYAVDVASGASRLISEDDQALTNAAATPDGSAIACTRGGQWPRKHYRGSGNSSLVLIPIAGGPGKVLTRDPENERWTQFAPDGKSFYYVADKSGEANLWRRDTDGGRPTQITQFTDGNVTYPTFSRSVDRVVFERNFSLWSLRLDAARSRPEELRIFAPSDFRTNPIRKETFTTGAQEVRLSPNGRTLAFVIHGEIWTQPAAGGESVRLTETPQREEEIAWSPDSNLLYFVSDRSGAPDLYVADVRSRETRRLTDTPDRSEGLPSPSPDGKSLAFVTGFGGQEMRVMPAAGGPDQRLVLDPRIATIAWSPDSRWIAYDRIKAHSAGALSEIFALRTDDPKPVNLTRYPCLNGSPAWAADGSTLYFLSDRTETPQVYSLGLRDPATEDAGTPRPAAAPAATNPAPAEVKIDLDDIHKRARQVTQAEAGVRAYGVSPDGKSVIYPLTQLGRTDLWRSGAGPATRLTQSGAETTQGLEIAADGRVFYLSGGGIRVLSPAAVPTAAPTVVPLAARMEIDTSALMLQLFDEAWRKMRDGFYDEKMHGCDWGKVRESYRPIVADITDKADFGAFFTLALGELNSSHTGISTGRVPPTGSPSLGVTLDPAYPGPGVRVRAVMPKGPADRDVTRLRPGDILLKLDGQSISNNEHLYQLLGDRPGRPLDLLVNTEPKPEGGRTLKIRPITAAAYRALEYDRWVRVREQKTAELSKGRLGYLHLSAMDAVNLEKFRRAAFGEMQEKDGLVLDLRFNGGGSIADEILAILQDRIFSYRTLRADPTRSPAPIKVFTRPVIVLINESSFSNAEAFPWGFRDLKLGKVVGLPTYGGCIGTGATDLIDGSTLRVPAVGAWTLNGINMENNGCPPDFTVENSHEDVLAERDRQLEKAVQELGKDARRERS